MGAGGGVRPVPEPAGEAGPGRGPGSGQRAAASVVPPLRVPAAAGVVAVGGSLGVLARALLVSAFPTAPGGWPWTTFWVNVAGSFVLGALLAVLGRGPDAGRRRAVRLGLGTGVLGGFTTYSTFALEVEQLLAAGRPGVAVAYASLSVVVGVSAAVAGAAVARRGGRRGIPAAEHAGGAA